MSFLNPVNEPVLRFSSTDADAPQINYNARTAGDVKTVLKACLVTGYGTKASAGWSIVNEVDHVAEFVSPSAAMSDYRLGIDDTSASSTTWYYQYQNNKKIMSDSTIKKNHNYINKTSPKNGWQLIVTPRGLYFVELICQETNQDVVARLTYWGAVKSTLVGKLGANIGFWCVGFGSPTTIPYQFFTKNPKAHYSLSTYTNLYLSSANLDVMGLSTAVSGTSSVDITAPLYLYSNDGFAAQQPGLLLKYIGSAITSVEKTTDSIVQSRPVLDVYLAREASTASQLLESIRVVNIYLDEWGF